MDNVLEECINTGECPACGNDIIEITYVDQDVDEYKELEECLICIKCKFKWRID